MPEVGRGEGENAEFSCGVTELERSPASEMLATMPASFVNQQIQLWPRRRRSKRTCPASVPARPTCREYFTEHQREFDKACFTVGVYSTREATQAAAAAVCSGSRSRRWPPARPGEARRGVGAVRLSGELVERAPRHAGRERGLAADRRTTGVTYWSQITKLTPNTFDKVKSYVHGGGGRGLDGHAEGDRRQGAPLRVSVDPQYGSGCPDRRRSSPRSPRNSPDVPNAPANIRRTRHLRGQPVRRLSVPPLRPHITVVGLGPAGTDFLGAPGGRPAGRLPPPVPAHGAPSGRGRSPDSPTFDHLYDRPRPSTRCTPPWSKSWWRRRGWGGGLRGAGLADGGRAQGGAAAGRRPVEVTVVPALSFLDLAWAALGIDPLAAGVRLVDAAAFPGGGAGSRARSWSPRRGRAICSRT